MSKTVTTTKRQETAFYMCYGFSVHRITFWKKADTFVPVFEIRGRGLEDISSRYRSGKAVINLKKLEENLNKLEELIKNEFELFIGGNGNGE